MGKLNDGRPDLCSQAATCKWATGLLECGWSKAHDGEDRGCPMGEHCTKYEFGKYEPCTRRSCAHNAGQGCCDYILNEKRCRPCRGGKDCEAFISDAEYRRSVQDAKKKEGLVYGRMVETPEHAKNKESVIRDIQREQAIEEMSGKMLALYTNGLSDGQIAKELGTYRHAVYRWRKRKGLASNAEKSEASSGCCGHTYEEVFGYYQQGMSDSEIAKQIGSAIPTVQHWRERNYLKPNVKKAPSVDYSGAMEMWKAGMSDSKIAKELGCAIRSVRTWRDKNGLQANFLKGGQRRE